MCACVCVCVCVSPTPPPSQTPPLHFHSPVSRGDYKRAEHHLLEAACVYSRCTPYHDVRGKVALCLAHLYVPERDVTQTQRYLKEVCELAEGGQKDLSDSGLVVLMCAIQHRLQLGGWDSATVTSLLDWAQRVNNVIVTFLCPPPLFFSSFSSFFFFFRFIGFFFF